MSDSENTIKLNSNNEILEIADFEPFFMYLFGMKIPENLKPNLSISLLPEIDVPALTGKLSSGKLDNSNPPSGSLLSSIY